MKTYSYVVTVKGHIPAESEQHAEKKVRNGVSISGSLMGGKLEVTVTILEEVKSD